MPPRGRRDSLRSGVPGRGGGARRAPAARRWSADPGHALISYLIHGPDIPHTLEAVAERLGVTIQARHSALGDALAPAEILARFIELAGRRGIVTLGDLLDAVRRGRPLQ